MTPRRKQRLIVTLTIVVGTIFAITFTLLALRENIDLFFTPTEVKAGDSPTNTRFRIGGMVVPGSIVRSLTGLDVKFDLTDTLETVTVKYSGILPDLFSEGQGIVAQGNLSTDGIFVADQVLAKHDETYMPPEVSAAIESAQNQE
ncbi:MAG: cytochrome c maturation protein CcmE [Acidiferrobacteraceae bacterium]|nr:cytochrome c maturation protein CcmE [Acidiferrobacteraceae bacterium]|tara:strand:+ start:3922 stop:4356 length:435 start_codon:yes stop_codon:yes gene_type:complete